MKQHTLLPFLILAIFSFIDTSVLVAQDKSVMTYNVRYGTANDGENIWDNRKESLANEIAFYEPDFFGVQEALHMQMEYLDRELPQYSYIGVGRDDGKTKGEFSGIFYHTDRVKLLKEGTFWLSETPEKPSVGWDAALERICTYGYFQYKKKKKHKIWYFNTHFDHKGDKARVESVDLIIEKVKELADPSEPIIVSGDFNLEPFSEPIKKMASVYQDSYTASGIKPFGPTTTIQQFNVDSDRRRRIDYIFTNDHIRVVKTAILSHWIDGHFNSDHFPVLSYFELR